MRASSGIAALTLLLPPCWAQAADLYARPSYGPPPYAQPLAVRSPWSGFYLGGLLGASIGEQKLDQHGANQFFAATGTGGATLAAPTSDPETPFGFDQYKTGLTGGVFAGYNYQFSRMVVGAEVDFAAKKLESSASESVAANAIYANTGIVG